MSTEVLGTAVAICLIPQLAMSQTVHSDRPGLVHPAHPLMQDVMLQHGLPRGLGGSSRLCRTAS